MSQANSPENTERKSLPMQPAVQRSLPAHPGQAPSPEMQWLSGGSFLMGSDYHYPDEAPAHAVSVDGFWIDRYAVTNQDFACFVAATGYVTLAERPPQIDGLALTEAMPGSLVFQQLAPKIGAADFTQWWAYVPGADWRHPQGPESSLEGKERFPVVHVAYEDAEAYAHWAGKVLPDEAEWEYAARGGLENAIYAWGNEFMPAGQRLAQTWQGVFPWQNLDPDGYAGPVPVGSFPPNGYGLYDMIGNVWEWTADWYSPHHPDEAGKACCAPHKPGGASREQSLDPDYHLPRKVLKGGSFLCAPNYCQRYRPAARSPQTIDSSTCNTGFRCLVRPGQIADQHMPG